MKPSRRPVRKPLRLAAAVFAGVAALAGCAAFETKQGEWIFNPSERSWGSSAVATTMRDEWIEFESTISGRAARLHVQVTGDVGEQPVLLYLHGARWNLAASAWRIERMRDLGFTVVAVDYRGFGRSSVESPTEDKAYEDARAAWAWIAARWPARPRYVFGHSLGGAIAIDLASRVDDERGTIVEGTFTSIPDVVASMRWGWLPVGWLITQRFDAAAKVARIGSPLLVVHGSEDRLIKPELGQRLYDAAADPKRFVLVEGGSHHNTNGMGQPLYREAVREMFGIGAEVRTVSAVERR
jgi:alpha-beta hydrolase superfamily lysophospholipase